MELSAGCVPKHLPLKTQHEKPMPKTLYCMVDENGIAKIGYSKDVEARKKLLERQTGKNLTVRETISAKGGMAPQIEQWWLHWITLDADPVRGDEWFDRSPKWLLEKLKTAADFGEFSLGDAEP